MTLYVIRPPNPPAGRDWTAAVPGQYLYNITGIVATLTTASGASPTALDASGHGRNGTYDPVIPPSVFVPGLVAGDLALQCQTPAFVNVNGVTVPPGGIRWDQDFAIAFWYRIDGGAGQTPDAFVASATPNPGFLLVRIHYGANGNVYQIGNNVADWRTALNSVPVDNNPHFVVVMWSGGVMSVSVDGAAVGFSLMGVAGSGGPMTDASWAEDGAGSPSGPHVMDEVAIWNTALTQANATAMFNAAAGGFAAYSAAVLALNPWGYWHLDDYAPPGGRQVTLAVTDGTNELEQLPTGFPVSAGLGPFRYSWTPDLNASTQVPSGSPTTVAIPRLILPAGYTVGTETPDLASGDRWSGITIWWDSNLMDAARGLNPYDYPPGAKLVYRQRKGAQ